MIYLAFVIANFIFVGGMVVGSSISEERGRNGGIILCSEKPTECKTEYNYLKLKEQLKK